MSVLLDKRYLVTHARDCSCLGDACLPALCVTAHEVALYLWGRVVPKHLIYDGEIPIRFHVIDVKIIEAFLTEKDVHRLGGDLMPCRFGTPATGIVCDIGTHGQDAPQLVYEFFWLPPDARPDNQAASAQA